MNARPPARGWGLGLVAAAHALLLAWAWTRSLAADPPGAPPPAALVAQLLAPASQARAREPIAPGPGSRVSAPAMPVLAVPDVSAWAAAAPPPVAAAPTTAGVPQPGPVPLAAEPGPAALALPLPRPPAPPPVAPRRTPADHAGCAEVPHPLALRERGIEGLVQLRVQVGSDGRARAVQLLGSSGWRLFDEAALAKARSCRFRPAYEGETAVESWVEFPVRFALARS